MYLNRHYIFDLFLLALYVQKWSLIFTKQKRSTFTQHGGTFSYEKITKEATNIRHTAVLKTGNPNLLESNSQIYYRPFAYYVIIAR